MKHVLCILAIICCMAPVYAQDAPVELFNGKNLDGWVVREGPADIWYVEDGVLVCNGVDTVRGWLGTAEEYGDFELTLEWKIPENGNSGVFLRVGEEPRQEPAYDAIEVQICDDNGSNYTEVLDVEHSGGIYPLVAPSKDMFKGANTWNRFVITCKGPHITVVYNGEKVVDIRTNRYARSFVWNDRKRRPMFMRPKSGYVALQSHGSMAWFRDISIRRLDSK